MNRTGPNPIVDKSMLFNSGCALSQRMRTDSGFFSYESQQERMSSSASASASAIDVFATLEENQAIQDMYNARFDKEDRDKRRERYRRGQTGGLYHRFRAFNHRDPELRHSDEHSAVFSVQQPPQQRQQRQSFMRDRDREPSVHNPRRKRDSYGRDSYGRDSYELDLREFDSYKRDSRECNNNNARIRYNSKFNNSIQKYEQGMESTAAVACNGGMDPNPKPLLKFLIDDDDDDDDMIIAGPGIATAVNTGVAAAVNSVVAAGTLLSTPAAADDDDWVTTGTMLSTRRAPAPTQVSAPTRAPAATQAPARGPVRASSSRNPKRRENQRQSLLPDEQMPTMFFGDNLFQQQPPPPPPPLPPQCNEMYDPEQPSIPAQSMLLPPPPPPPPPPPVPLQSMPLASFMQAPYQQQHISMYVPPAFAQPQQPQQHFQSCATSTAFAPYGQSNHYTQFPVHAQPQPQQQEEFSQTDIQSLLSALSTTAAVSGEAAAPATAAAVAVNPTSVQNALDSLRKLLVQASSGK